MALHPTLFQYLKPTDRQVEEMAVCRNAVAGCAGILDSVIPNGADKDRVLTLLREAGMWANVAITREPDGTPRQ